MEFNKMSNNSKAKKEALALQLVRKLHLKRYPVIAKATFRRERPDLVALLDAMQQDADNMPARLKAYLVRENLWIEGDMTLTERGQKVKTTGLFEASERGLYHIWYTDNDPLLGTRPVMMQRDTAFFEPKTKGWLKGADAARSAFRVDEELQIEVLEEVYDGKKSKHSKNTLTLAKLEPEVICSWEKSVDVELNWQLDLSHSLVKLKGQLDVLEFQGKPSNRPELLGLSIHAFADYFSLIMQSIAGQFEGHWDSREQRMAVTIESIQQYPSAVDNFKIGIRNIHQLETNVGQFDSTQMQHIPIKPEDQLDAEQWHSHWLQSFYSRGYQSSEKARQQQAKWLDNKALADFEVPLIYGANLLDCLAREQHPQAFWHVAAMADLTPSKSKKLRLPISLVNGEPLALNELIAKLSGAETVEQMIYSDRYVHTSRHSRNLAAVAACINDVEGQLLTLGLQKGNEAKLPDNWQREILKKQNDNHGRYWVFFGSSHIYCWECSSGLDFMHETEAGLVVAGTPGFTPKEENELPRYLQDAIIKIKSVEVA
jgi:hypothetical protein